MISIDYLWKADIHTDKMNLLRDNEFGAPENKKKHTTPWCQWAACRALFVSALIAKESGVLIFWCPIRLSPTEIDSLKLFATDYTSWEHIATKIVRPQTPPGPVDHESRL